MPRRNGALVTIATFSSTFEAGLAKGALEAIGIRPYVSGEELGSFSRNRGGIAEGALQVFESDRNDALAELRRLSFTVISRSEDP